MRLWHYELIPHLPRQQLLGQHRENAALRGKGWGKKHATIDYVFKYPYIYLFNYHMIIMNEMAERGYNVSSEWRNFRYRGKILGYDMSEFTSNGIPDLYPEHNDNYLIECIENLAQKGIFIEL